MIYANKRVHVPSYTVAVLAQAMMQAAGINAQIEVLEWATAASTCHNTGKYQMSSVLVFVADRSLAELREQFSATRPSSAAQGVWTTRKGRRS